jgi:parallel beta helix pectate lyase-like protein
MRISRRSAVAIGVLVLLSGVVAVGRWYEKQNPAAEQTVGATLVNVTSGADRGPGTLREALFIAAAATGNATVAIKVAQITVQTALPPLVNTHGVSVVARPPGAQIDARALPAGAVFDIAGANTSIEGLHISNCPGAAILVRAVRFRLRSTTIDSCAVGVEVAENASDTLLEGNHFAKNKVAVRFGAAGRNTVVDKNEFANDKEAALWAVRSGSDVRGDPISVHDNRFSDEHTGVVAGNIPILVEKNDFFNSQEAAVHLVGAGAVIRGNRISGGPGMGVVVENVRSAIIDNNEIDGLAAYGVMVRGSANTLVRANRVHNTGYGLAFVLGDAKSPSTAVENIIIEPKFNGIDVIGDSPILRRNQVLRPHALPLHVDGFSPPGGQKVQAQPFLDNNTFDKGGWTPTAASPAATTPAEPAPAASAGDAKPQTSQ